jgi:hypothetical protein
MRWRSICPVVVVAAAIAWATAAVAATLTPTDDPLRGSNFQGADADQLDENGHVDWNAFKARVVHNHDANDQDTTFGGGTKETDPALWFFEKKPDGVTPGKSNIREAWSAVDQPTGSGRTFLYLAFTRADPEGTTFLTFELNQVRGTWVNDRNERIPCRTDGDVLVSYEISGSDAEVSLNRWKRKGNPDASGCDRQGTIEPLGAVTANVQAQGAMNQVGIVNFLPGAGSGIGTRLFGEAALDLNALFGPEFSDGCYAFGSIWMHSRSSTQFSSQMQDYVSPQPIDLRTCAAEGTKFFDLDADGVRDDNEPGLPGFQIYADYNGNGQLDSGEPSTVSDSKGRYILNDIRRPTYTLRERLLPPRRRATKRWLCSFPNEHTEGGFGGPGLGFPCGWGPINSPQEPNAKGRDFGNWYPAQLTVIKDLVPADDPGRFNLFVNGSRVLENAGNAASTRLAVPPGRYTLTEDAVPPAELDQYTRTASCKLFNRRARVRSDSASIKLAAGQRGECRILNARVGVPAIMIDKTGPGHAEAGDTLHYTMRVTNPGTVPFAADDVQVTDSNCDRDNPPKLTDKSDGDGADDSAGTLDPGDVWTYKCSVKTDAPGEDCVLQTVRNTATVSGDAQGTTVRYSSTIDTTLTCPDTPPPDPPDPPDPPIPPDPPDPPVPPQPDEPIPPTPIVPGLPDVPSAVFPDVARPPVAGAAGVAGASASQLARCVTRLPRMAIRGRHISRVSVFVNGRRIRVIRPAVLARRLRIRSLARHRVTPGRRYTIVARVQFRLGSGTRPLTLVRRVRICRALLPRFTG